MAGEIPAVGAPAAPTEEVSLRDTIAANLAEATKEPSAPDAAAEATPVAVDATPSSSTDASGPAAAPAATDGRARNPDGTFAPKPAEAAAPKVDTPAPVAEPAAPAHKMPTSFRREVQAEWDKASPALREEVIRRETAFSQGISQYKALADRAKPIDDAIAPYRQIMQQHGMNEAESVKRLLDTQYALTMGQPQQKQEIINNLIAEYKLPVRLAVQGADGNWQLVEAAQPRPQPAPQQAQPQNIDALLEQKLTQREITNQLREFVNAKDASGSPQYPHYERVKDDMALILESGRAADLPGAYKLALRLHDDIWQEQQQATAQADAAKKAAEKAAAAQRARSNAVSIRTSTPSGAATANGDKNLRDQIRDNLREASSGRL